MPTFSDHSKAELSTVHPDLRLIMEAVIDAFDIRIIEGHRDKERQTKLYRQGKSQLQYPDSKHNQEPSHAVDVAPWPIDWQAYDRFYLMAGHIQQAAWRLLRRGEINHKIRWGGDWDGDRQLDDQAFDDLPHVELV